MKCPRCDSEMTDVTKHGVVIDVCSVCGGMWLDKGELAKITGQLREAEASLDRELAGIRAGREPIQERMPVGDEHRRYEHAYHDRERAYHHHDKYKDRKKSGFEKLFDIFD